MALAVCVRAARSLERSRARDVVACNTASFAVDGHVSAKVVGSYHGVDLGCLETLYAVSNREDEGSSGKDATAEPPAEHVGGQGGGVP